MSSVLVRTKKGGWASLAGHHSGAVIPQEEARANLKLSASAPDLIARLEEVTAELSQMHNYYYPACEGGCPTAEYIIKARAAIAKATGA